MVKVNEQFAPHPNLKAYYYVCVISVSIIFMAWMLPLSIGALVFLPPNDALVMAISLLVPFFTGLGLVVFWIPKYYTSITYALTDHEIIVRKGVWWKRASFVPYNRITNINIIQGPVARHFGLGTVLIQTAGFSSGGSSSTPRPAEAVIFGIKNFEEIKDNIMNFVRGMKPVAVEAKAEAIAPEALNLQILSELKKIRKALEK